MLVVEDHEESAEGLVELLGLWGYEGHSAPNAEQALELLASWTPEVVIADIGLPGMNGYEFARRLRKLPEHASTLLIALTGYGDHTDDFTSSGFDHRLIKPLDLTSLEQLLAARSVATR